jgi:hypothetical protein
VTRIVPAPMGRASPSNFVFFRTVISFVFIFQNELVSVHYLFLSRAVRAAIFTATFPPGAGTSDVKPGRNCNRSVC